MIKIKDRLILGAVSGFAGNLFKLVIAKAANPHHLKSSHY